ncbi:MAG TPA: hypothetical protein VLG67_04685 [Candidatus Saccharimonadales bacterium]|nr:hypothetical protein [Candidatus Saccharimonadales bacterium]
MKRFLPLILFIFFLIPNFTSKLYAQSEQPTQPAPTPVGTVVKLDFTIPGIGTESGNLTPLNGVRNITLYFFNPEVNSDDPAVKPIASFKTQATYDSNPDSPTYGSFVNQDIDLGTEVPDGKYQISFKPDHALSKLLKERDQDVGGKVIEIHGTYGESINITNQKVIVGDIYPAGAEDNLMDINDYNALVSCFGTKADSAGCTDKKAADLDDNGTIDGVDYNLMFNSFKTLLELGLPVPSIFQITIKPTSKPTILKPTPQPTVVKKQAKVTPKKSSGAGSIFTIFGLIFVLLIAGAVIFFILKKRKSKQKSAIEMQQDYINAKPGEEGEGKQAGGEEIVDKEFFVKKQVDDTTNNRIVLTLTDDNGPTLGYFSGENVIDGFSKVKGVLKKDGDKVYIEVESITPEEETAA